MILSKQVKDEDILNGYGDGTYLADKFNDFNIFKVG